MLLALPSHGDVVYCKRHFSPSSNHFFLLSFRTMANNFFTQKSGVWVAETDSSQLLEMGLLLSTALLVKLPKMSHISNLTLRGKQSSCSNDLIHVAFPCYPLLSPRCI